MLKTETIAAESGTETSPLLQKPSSFYLSASQKEDNFHCHDDKSVDGKITSNQKAKRVLWISVLICLIFMACEVAGGFLANSLAIVTDAAHLLTDFASMLISLFSLYIAGRAPSQRMSFGFHRAEVLGAFFSVFMIWVVTGILVVLAISRIISRDFEVNAGIMAVTAALGVLVNLIMGGLLYFGGHAHSHGGSAHSHGSHAHAHNGNGLEDNMQGNDHSHVSDEQNINVRAAFIHVIGDLLQSVGVLIAALVIYFKPEWGIVDPICTLMFSIIVLFTTIYILRDAMVVLLEGRPSSIDFSEVFTNLEAIEGVRKAHDLRIWALTMDKVAVSVHLEVDPTANGQEVLRKTRFMLRKRHGVHESTVQIEGHEPEKDCRQCIVPSS